MGKNPAFQFYIKDWLSDPELQSASSASRGIWINALCYMWQSKERGKLEGTTQSLCQLLNCTEEEFNIFSTDSHNFKFCDIERNQNVSSVTQSDKKVTLINRRMLREEKERISHLKRQYKYRAKKRGQLSDAKVDANDTVLSPSPSPIINNNKGNYTPVTLKKYYKNDRGNFICLTCNKEFTFYQNIKQHLETHKEQQKK